MLLKKVNKYFLISREDLSDNNPDIWKKSVIRLVSVTAFIGMGIIILDSCIEAARINAWFVYAINAVFVALGFTTFYLTKKNIKLSVVLFMMALVAASLAIYFCVRDEKLYNLGILLLYTLPIFSRIFFGIKTAVFFIVINFSGLFILALNIESPDIFKLKIALESSNIYIHGVLFFFFNICIPLGVFRVLYTLEVSQKKYMELNKELKISKDVYRDVFENKGSASIICDENHKIVKANSSFLELSSYSREDILGKSVGNIIDILPYHFFQKTNSKRCSLINKDGTSVPCLVNSSNFSNQNRYILSFADTSTQTRAEQALLEYENRKQFLKHYDSLTELPNREYLLQKLREHSIETFSNGEVFAAICIRPAHFNYIEQKYGPVVGNILLKKIGSLMDKRFEDHFCIAKLRGLSFCLITRSFAQEAQLNNSIKNIYSQLPDRVTISGIDIELFFYCGVAVCPKNSTRAEEIIKHAELARNYAKATFARKPFFFNPSLNTRHVEQIEIEIQLKKALESEMFNIVYQPKVDKRGNIVSAEALVRMEPTPCGNNIGPGGFIPVAEKSGLITRLEELIINMVLNFLSRRIRENKTIVPVSINISGRNIGNIDFASDFMSLLKNYNVSPEFVEIEITETALMVAEQSARENLRKLKDFGVSVNIDDFGTGYSSLGKLMDLPVDTLKIDKSFLDKIPENQKHVSIIKTIINLGNQLNLKIIAEGVETEAQKYFLMSSGCHEFQGYYFYRPLSEKQFEREMDSITFSVNSEHGGRYQAIVID